MSICENTSPGAVGYDYPFCEHKEARKEYGPVWAGVRSPKGGMFVCNPLPTHLGEGTWLFGRHRNYMQVDPQLIFHDVPRSEWIEEYVIERLVKLDRLSGGITSCRVTLAREQSSHRQGNMYSVLVEVRMPPQHDLAAKKQKKIKDMSAQLPALINQGFTALERQMRKTNALRRHEDRGDESEPHGMIEQLFAEGYGFIRTVGDNRQYYFHKESVLHGDFDSLSIGTEVRFNPEEGRKGPQASSVQIVSKLGPQSAR